jgi:class 3 adenylate cyclase
MPVTSVVTVLACDLVESTALMARVGDDAADDIRRDVFARWRAAVEREGGLVVKTIGDAVMAVFSSSAVQAVSAAIALRDTLADPALGHDLRIRVGIATGEAAEEHDDWFGTPVVEAFRLCSQAGPDEIFLTAVSRRVVGSRGGYDFVDVGPLALKGLPEPVHTFALVREGAPPPRPRPLTTRRSRKLRVATYVASFVVPALVVVLVVVLATRDGTHAVPPASVDVRHLGYTPRLQPRRCAEGESAGDPAVRCWTLVVPIDRAKPHGPVERLRVVEAPALQARAAPEITFAGNALPAVSSDLRAISDQYQMVTRGDAGSEPNLLCDDERRDRAHRLGMTWLAARRLLYEQLDACRARLVARGIDLARFGPNDIADDVRDLVIAAHLGRVDVRALSAGAIPLYALLRRSPEIVHAVFFGSPETPSRNAFDYAQVGDDALRSYARLCAANATCSSIAPDFLQHIETQLAALRAAPRTVMVRAPDGTPLRVVVDRDRAFEALWLALHDTSAYGYVALVSASNAPTFAAAILEILHLDPDLVLTGFPDNGAAIDPDMRSIVWACQRSGATTPADIETTRQILPDWAALTDSDGLARCRRWHIPLVPALGTPVPSSVPTLVFYGEREPEAPSTERLREMFPAAQLVALRGQVTSKSGVWPPCLAAYRDAFFEHPTRPVGAAACASTAAPIRYQRTPHSL